MKKLLRKWLLSGEEAPVVRIECVQNAALIFHYAASTDEEELMHIWQRLQDTFNPSIVVMVPDTVEFHKVVEVRS